MNHQAMLLPLLAVFAFGLCPQPALAQSPPDANQERARELYQNGSMLYDEGRYEDAIVAFQEAYRLSEQPKLLFNIAQAQERLGRYQDALDMLSRYRAYAPAEERESLDRRIRNLERRIEEQGQTPTTPQVTTAQPTTSTPPSTTTTPASTPTTPSTDDDDGGARVLPIALFSVGGVGLAAGGYFGLTARSARAEAAALCVDGGAGVLCPGAAADALNRDRARSLLADISFGVGAAGIIGGTLTSLLGGQTGADGANLGLSVGLTPGGGALTWSGSF